MSTADEETPLKANKNETTTDATDHDAIAPLSVRLKEVFQVYWHLGFIAFGGPAAHIGILQDHLIRVHNWLTEEQFLELFALGQGLPGPTSTQLLIGTAATHGGMLGGMLAFVMWFLPAFTFLTFTSIKMYDVVDPNNPWFLGVPAAAVAIICKAFYGFGGKLDKLGKAIAMAACATSILINHDGRIPSTSSQFVYPALLFGGGAFTLLDSFSKNPIGEYVKPAANADKSEDRKLAKKIGMNFGNGIFMLFLWAGILVTNTVLVQKLGVVNPYLEIFELFFRVGSLVFGGGVVIVPMLQPEVVPAWMSDEQFFQGLGLAQSMPGPFFNFAAFLGATRAGFGGAVAANLGLFGPGFILIFAMLPFWSHVRGYAWFKALLKGLNAAAIGLIGGACVFLYAKSVRDASGAIVFVICGGLTTFYSLGAPWTIATGAVLGGILNLAQLGQIPYE